jgi:3-dehydro-L-gulonate 2-dehydrogenase
MIAAMMTLGRATHQISSVAVEETAISQMFLALNPGAFGPSQEAERIADAVVASLHDCAPAKPGSKVRYPGEEALRLREENTRLGLPVEPEVWKEIVGLGDPG